MADNQGLTIGKKIEQYLKEINTTPIELAEKLGVTSQYVYNVIGGKQLGRKAATKWGAVLNIKPNWFLTGEGEMLKGNEQSLKKEAFLDNYKLVPMYNFDAVGGVYKTNDVVDTPNCIEKYIPFIDAKTDDICIPITGKSMMPMYPPGCIVLLREVTQWREYFGYGNVFVLVLTDGRRILKEVQKSDNDAKNSILCVSYNADYKSEDLPKSMIDMVFKVISVLVHEGF